MTRREPSIERFTGSIVFLQHTLVVLAATAFCVSAAASSTPSETLAGWSPGPAEQEAGAGLVSGWATAGGDTLAAVALWPSPAISAAGGASPGAAVVLARALADRAAHSVDGARPLVFIAPEGLAVGLVAPVRQEKAVWKAMRDLLRPKKRRAWAALEQDHAHERQESPQAAVSAAVLRLVFPHDSRAWLDALVESATQEVGREDAAAVIERVRSATSALRVAGPSGIAERAFAALSEDFAPDLQSSTSLERAVEQGSGREALDLDPQSNILLITDDGEFGDQSSIGVGYRLPPTLSARDRSVLPVLLEALSEGQGSLAQRLNIAVETKSAPRVELLAAHDGALALSMIATVPAEDTLRAWRVMRALSHSLADLSFREAAVLRARQRVDARVKAIRQDAGALLEAALADLPGRWPPSNRWKSPVRGSDLRETVRALFSRERQVAVLLGSLPESLAASAEFEKAAEISWSEFDPASTRLGTRADQRAPRAPEQDRWIKDLLARLGAERFERQSPSFHASYLLSEDAPWGRVEAVVDFDGGARGSNLRLRSGRTHWTSKAEDPSRNGVFSPHETVPSEDESESAAPTAGRLEALRYREPVLLLSEIVRSQTPRDLLEVDCEQGHCLALRAEPIPGLVVMMVIDPVGGLPIEIRTWWPDGADAAEPDETARISEWSTSDGVMIVRDFDLIDAIGSGSRNLHLIEWRWIAEPKDDDV